MFVFITNSTISGRTNEPKLYFGRFFPLISRTQKITETKPNWTKPTQPIKHPPPPTQRGLLNNKSNHQLIEYCLFPPIATVVIFLFDMYLFSGFLEFYTCISSLGGLGVCMPNPFCSYMVPGLSTQPRSGLLHDTMQFRDLCADSRTCGSCVRCKHEFKEHPHAFSTAHKSDDPHNSRKDDHNPTCATFWSPRRSGRQKRSCQSRVQALTGQESRVQAGLWWGGGAISLSLLVSLSYSRPLRCI